MIGSDQEYRLSKFYKDDFLDYPKKNIDIVDKVYRIYEGDIVPGYILNIDNNIFFISAYSLLNIDLPGVFSLDKNFKVRLIDESLVDNTLIRHSDMNYDVNTIDLQEGVTVSDLDNFLNPNTTNSKRHGYYYNITISRLGNNHFEPISSDEYENNKSYIFKDFGFYYFGSTVFDEPLFNSRYELFQTYVTYCFKVLEPYLEKQEVLSIGEIGVQMNKTYQKNMSLCLYLGEFSSEVIFKTIVSRRSSNGPLIVTKDKIPENHCYLILNISKSLYGLSSIEEAIATIQENSIEQYLDCIFFRKTKLKAYHNINFYDKETLLTAKKFELGVFNNYTSLNTFVGRLTLFRRNIKSIDINIER